MMQTLTIGAVASQAVLTTSAIRYYESAGLLPAPLQVRGQRRYSPAVFVRLAVIRSARELGFSIAELRELFREFPDDIPASERWHRLAKRKMTQLDEQIAWSERIRSDLRATLECGCETFASCSLISGRVASATAV